MSLRDHVISLRCVLLRYNPIRHPITLLSVGNPTAQSPVFVSGNYFHSVKRLERACRGLDCYILVACSAGINVWCAAGVCDFNEHKIADAVHATALASVVEHRELILPQLAAVGIDLSSLKKESGFVGRWGPASMFDIPAFVAGGNEVTAPMRSVEFPFADRWYNAVGMFNVFLLLPIFAWLLWGSSGAHLLLLTNFVTIFSSFLLYHWLPCRYPSNNVVLVGLVVASVLVLDATVLRPTSRGVLLWRLGCSVFVTLLVAIDMLGSTPYFKTTIAHWLRTFDNESLFQPEVTDQCVGCKRCVDVCPKAVFAIDTGRARVNSAAQCCECLACVKQCPVTAIINRNGTVHKDDIKSIQGLEAVMRPKGDNP